MKELTVRRNDAGQRLDRFVGKAVPLLPETLLQKYIRIKRIKLNGKGAKRDTRLSEGDVLSLYINDEFFEKPREENAYLKVGKPRINIVYEDENIILADKKPGVLCHSAGAWDYNTLIANIQAYLAQKGEWDPRGENSFAPALCNRIDRNTGGIVIAAKNAEALRILNDKIRDREIEKYYLCAVQGKPKQPRGRLENYLFKDAAKNQVYGMPLLGDGKYGSERFNKNFGEKGQALYSYKLEFAFPTDAGILEYLRGKCFTVESVEFAEKYFGIASLDGI